MLCSSSKRDSTLQPSACSPLWRASPATSAVSPNRATIFMNPLAALRLSPPALHVPDASDGVENVSELIAVMVMGHPVRWRCPDHWPYTLHVSACCPCCCWADCEVLSLFSQIVYALFLITPRSRGPMRRMGHDADLDAAELDMPLNGQTVLPRNSVSVQHPI